MKIAALVEQGAKPALIRRIHRRSGRGRDIVAKAILCEPEKFPLKLHVKILAVLWPLLYDPPRDIPTPETVSDWDALVRLRGERFARGEDLWSEDDSLLIDCRTDMRRWSFLSQREAAIERKRRLPRTGTVVDLDDDTRDEMEM